MSRGKQQIRPNRPTGLNPGASPFAIRPDLSQNKYSALAHFPPIIPSAQPQISSSNMLILKKPFSKDPEPSSQSPSGKLRFSQKQTSGSYAMKQPENFAEVVS